MTKVAKTPEFTEDFIQLTPFLVMYIKRKGSIAGPTFKFPLMGPFIQALHPKFEGYLEQWASGPLSCVSVFHKYVFLALTIPLNTAISCKSPPAHPLLQICRPRIRPRHSPQGLQVALIRRAMHCSRCQGHPRPQSMGLPPGQGPRRVPKRPDSSVHQQGHLLVPPCPRKGLGQLL